MIDLQELCENVTQLTQEVGEFIRGERKHFNQNAVEKKGHNDLVSYVDKQAERMLVDGLSEILPGSGFITEEKTSSVKGELYNWIIDPLDGTTNFIHGLPCFCISIGLLQGNTLVLGVVHELNLDECFYAWENGGAYMNGNKIKVSAEKNLGDSLIATGFPYHNYERMEAYMEVFDYCMRNTHGLRRLGSAAADLAYVACGRFEAFYEYGLNAWDVAGGIVLVKEAGGQVTDFSGGENHLFGKEILSSNGSIHEDFLHVIMDKFSKDE
ncbi:MAG TPA: inositol monophosphatase family protein [Bacteroidia bacterium]|mgnify:CR=1 FL=1|nr:inositol monophosphatase family protein [Bacteroidia bacterium]HNP98641.1 inositol monophosphatase family protein [Bacteroidia bacterium]